MAVKIIALVAAMYAAVLLTKNTFNRIIFLFVLDALALILLAITGAPEIKLVFFAACGFIINTLMFLLPDSGNETAGLKITDYIFMAAAFALLAAFIVFFAVSKHGSAPAIPAVKAYGAIFLVFCAVFTGLYFVIKEKSGETENE